MLGFESRCWKEKFGGAYLGQEMNHVPRSGLMEKCVIFGEQANVQNGWGIGLAKPERNLERQVPWLNRSGTAGSWKVRDALLSSLRFIPLKRKSHCGFLSKQGTGQFSFYHGKNTYPELYPLSKCLSKCAVLFITGTTWHSRSLELTILQNWNFIAVE